MQACYSDFTLNFTLKLLWSKIPNLEQVLSFKITPITTTVSFKITPTTTTTLVVVSVILNLSTCSLVLVQTGLKQLQTPGLAPLLPSRLESSNATCYSHIQPLTCMCAEDVKYCGYTMKQRV